MNASMMAEIKRRADKYCRDNAVKLSPSRYQEHIENAMVLGATMVLEQQQDKRIEAMCGMSPREDDES